MRVRNYGQYCPVARGAEIFAERWTPIILRNLLNGYDTFNDLSAGAPGLSRSLLTKRLQELERAELITSRPKPNGHGSIYELTAAGRDIKPVVVALATWADQWTDVTPEHAHPGMVLWAWGGQYVAHDKLPEERTVVRFDFEVRGMSISSWMLIEDRDTEFCAFDPGFGDDLVVEIRDPVAFARWHLGEITWGTALRSGGLRVTGPGDLRRALPTWNLAPDAWNQRRAARLVGAP